MTVIRLIGGLTPGDASDPRTFPEIFNAAADVIDASEAGLSVVEGDVGTLQDDVVELETRGFRIVDTLYFTSSGTFTKADFPFLRAIRVKCVGAGGGSGGHAATASGQGAAGGPGGGGGFAESFITDIAGLASSVTVTRGSGGNGGASGNNSGSGGGTSSFGSLVVAPGGGGGSGGPSTAPGLPVGGGGAGAGFSGLVGDLVIPGGAGTIGQVFNANQTKTGAAGTTFFNHGLRGERITQFEGSPQEFAGVTDPTGFGGGARGPAANDNRVANSGAPGQNGLVIVEVFA